MMADLQDIRTGGKGQLIGALLLATAVVLRIVLAFQPGIWADEIFSLAMATGHSLEHSADEADPAFGDYVEPVDPRPAADFRRYAEHDAPPAGASRVVRAVKRSDTSPPLYYLVLNLWTRTLGTSDAVLRLFSVLCAVACFPLLWALADDLGGKRAAWATCVLFAFSPLALYYSAEGRMYSLTWLVGLSMAWSTLALTKDGPRPWLAAVWILSAVSALLTHYFLAFAIAACLIWMFVHPNRLSRVHGIALIAVTSIAVLPWYVQVPETLSLWRVTGGWLDTPLTLWDAALNPIKMLWSYVSVAGEWGGARWSDLLPLVAYSTLGAAILRLGIGPLFTEHRQLLWFWVLASVAGPLAFDVVLGTNASSIVRYALPGFPAAMLLVGVGLSRLPAQAYVIGLVLLPLVWLPGVRKVYEGPARYWSPYPEVAARLDAWSGPEDVVVVHSIPSGVIATARYLDPSRPIVSWVVQLDQKSVPEDIQKVSSSHRRIAVVKIHDLMEPSPAEEWLRQNRTVDRMETLFRSQSTRSEITYFERGLGD